MSNYLGAAGIGVRDLETSEQFYCSVFGMKRALFLELDQMDEIILSFPGSQGAAVVLMHYTDGSDPDYADNPVKLAFYVDDVEACVEAITQQKCEIVQKPTRYERLGNVTIAFGKDPDGYVVEMIQKPPRG